MNAAAMSDKTRPAIFYGAGGEAQKRTPEWLLKGLVPVCFADGDRNKHYTKLAVLADDAGKAREFDILPLEAAIEKHPDYLLYVTVGYRNLREVTDALLARGIPQERIRYPDPVEWRRGCHSMGREIHLRKKYCTCCVPQAQEFDRSGDFPTDLQRYQAHCSQMVRDIKEGRPTYCDGCANLQDGFFEIQPELSQVIIETLDGSYCNVKCVYCPTFPKPSDELLRQSHEDVMNTLRGIATLPNHKNLEIMFASGEMTIAPFCDEALAFIQAHGMRLAVLTNAAVYKEKIRELLQEGRAFVLVTLESTNPETYAKCKRVDCGRAVLRNIEKYAAAGHFCLKWIVLEGLNDTREDVTGVLDLAARIGAPIQLTDNYHNRERPMSENALEICLFFLRYAKEKGVPVSYIIRENFHPADLERIENYQKELWQSP